MSPTSGVAPPRLKRMSRIARPIVALARNPEPKTFAPPFTPSRFATGPLTIVRGAQGWVVDCTPFKLKASSSSASTAASTTGRYSGRQPAITALIATASTVALPPRGGSGPSSSAGSRRVPASIARTRSGVGGTTGSPSVHPCS